MGSVLFLCLKAVKTFETPYDWAIFCGLLAVEVPSYLNVVRLWWVNVRR